jgi:glycosyltransferase involved in cell wall biosynthesis
MTGMEPSITAIGRDKEFPAYAVLVRTYNSGQTIGDLLESLFCLEQVLSRVIVVDSGSKDDTLEICRSYGCEIYLYEGSAFNYSKSLNQGFFVIDEAYCLVISSDVRVLRRGLFSCMLAALRSASAAVADVNFTAPEFSVQVHDLTDFNGKNEIWNPCALYLTKYVHELKFDERIPASEDQLFALRLFQLGHRTVELRGPWIAYGNPRVSGRKRNNGLVATAYYVHRKDLSLVSIMRVARRALRKFASGELQEFVRDGALASRLVMARYFEPRFASRYFKEESKRFPFLGSRWTRLIFVKQCRLHICSLSALWKTRS